MKYLFENWNQFINEVADYKIEFDDGYNKEYSFTVVDGERTHKYGVEIKQISYIREDGQEITGVYEIMFGRRVPDEYLDYSRITLGRKAALEVASTMRNIFYDWIENEDFFILFYEGSEEKQRVYDQILRRVEKRVTNKELATAEYDSGPDKYYYIANMDYFRKLEEEDPDDAPTQIKAHTAYLRRLGFRPKTLIKPQQMVRDIYTKQKEASLAESQLNEAPPLGGFGYFDTPRKGGKPAIGAVSSKADPEYKPKVAEFFDKTRDHWYIVFPQDISRLGGSFRDTKTGPLDLPKNHIFMRWLRNQNWDPEGKYMVVLSSPLALDFDAPRWQIVHDIIGHALGMEEGVNKVQEDYITKFRLDGKSDADMGNRFTNVVALLQSYLPDMFKMSGRYVPGRTPEEVAKYGLDTEDIETDVLGAMFLDKGPDLSKIDWDSIPFSKDEVLFVANELQKEVDDFKESIPKGEPFVFRPW